MSDAIDLSQQPPGSVPVTDAIPPQAAVAYRQQEEAARHRLREWSQDDTANVEFYKDSITGEDLCKIRFPGQRREVPILGASPQLRTRFRRQWQAYQNNSSAIEGQTVLRDVAWVDEGARDLLKAYGIVTLEALANVNDESLRGLGPGVRALRDRAKVEAERMTKAAAYTDLKDEIGNLRAEIASLRAIPAPAAPGTRPRRGRPPKAAAE